MIYLVLVAVFIAAYAWSETVRLGSELQSLKQQIRNLELQLRKLSDSAFVSGKVKEKEKAEDLSIKPKPTSGISSVPIHPSAPPVPVPIPPALPAVTALNEARKEKDKEKENHSEPQLPLQPVVELTARSGQSNPSLAESQAPDPVISRTKRSDEAEPAESIDWLGELGLRPPKDSGESTESRLGVWWATRIGILMAVIGAVFFGIYINLNASPLLRLLQLTIGSAVALALAVWFEKKSPRITPVVQSGALAVLYVAAFGSFALSGIRIFTSPLPSAVLQSGVVVGVVSFSLWKRRRAMVNFAVLLGYISAWFSLAHALAEFSLCAALAWTVVAFWLRGKTGWTTPGSWSVVGNLVLFLLALNFWNQNQLAAPGLLLGWLFWLLVLALTLGAEIWMPADRRKDTRHAGQFYLWGATAGALGLGWVFTRNFHPDHLDLFYFVFGLALLVNGWLAQRRQLEETISLPLTLKGILWLALGWMEILDGEARWLVLLGQSAVVAWMWPRRFSRWVELTWRGVWFFGFFYFIRETVAGKSHEIAWWSTSIYLLGSMGLFVWEANQLRERGGLSLRKRWPVYSWTGFLLAIGIFSAATLHFSKDHLGYGLLIWFLALAGLCWRFRIVPLTAVVAASFTGMLAHLWISAQAAWSGSSFQLLPQALGWAGVTFGCIYLVWKQGPKSGVIQVLEYGFQALWILAVMLGFKKWINPEGGWIALAALGLALPGLAKRFPFYTLRQMVVFPWIMLWLFWVDEESEVNFWLDWVLLAGVWVSWQITRPWKPAADVPGAEEKPAWVPSSLIASLAGVWTFSVLYRQVETPYLFYGLVLMGGVYTFFWLRVVNSSGLFWSWAAVALGMIQWMVMMTSKSNTVLESASLNWLISGLILGVGSCLMARVQTQKSMGQSSPERKGIQWLGSLAGLVFVFIALSMPLFGLGPRLTLLWGSAAMGLFVFGMALRSQPARLVALMGLGVCILRLFIYDIQETLHRIFAFGALGVLLLGIGYLYNRFGKTMEE